MPRQTPAATQAEALELQRRQFAMLEVQHERAEQIQAESAQPVAGSRKALAVVLPIIIVLIGYLTWLLFRRWV